MAGTNGKGSTIAFMRAALEAAGKRVHAYTSPHLVSFHERITLGGRAIGEAELAALLREVEEVNGGAPITLFEATTCAALLAFAREPADFTLLEVGMGGRLDATNVAALQPALCVIAPVSLDHEAFLGRTVAAIAAEKAGILRPGVRAVVGAQPPAALGALRARATEVGCELAVCGQEWEVREADDGSGALRFRDGAGELALPPPALLGAHQAHNAGLAVAALRALGAAPTDALAAGVRDARWPARLQRLHDGSLPAAAAAAAGAAVEVWVDGGHNPAAGEALASALGRLPAARTVLVVGLLASKDANGFLAPLTAAAADLVAVRATGELPSPPMEAAAVADAARTAGCAGDVTTADSLADAMAAAARAPRPYAPRLTRVVLCGSLYMAGDALRLNGKGIDAGAPPLAPPSPRPPLVTTHICLGGNLGDRGRVLQRALENLRSVGVVSAVSALYVTAPQHVVEQPDFLNAACTLVTRLPPSALLLRLKEIEGRMGRDFGGIRYGPRVVDLDIALYGAEVVDEETAVGPLNVPHKLMHQRTFVLRPLCDIAPEVRHAAFGGASIGELYAKLCAAEASEAAAAGAPPPRFPIRVVPIRQDLTWELGGRTLVMGILNVTPDSFSDGGRLDGPAAAAAAAEAMVAAGVDVIDIGAESTRPGAARVTEEEELRRLLPAIAAIRASASAATAKALISVDTTRAAVAAAAVEAGADILNDISGGTFDARMLPTAAKCKVPIILMHTRGTPAEMQSRAEYADLIPEVCAELGAQCRAAAAAGVPPWHVLVDPGIGFAKTGDHNLALLRHENLGAFVRHFTEATPPLAVGSLVGASRKGFIGRAIGEPDPTRRQWGNAAAVCAAVAGGADVVRVHEVDEMRQVAKMADAIYREAKAPPSANL